MADGVCMFPSPPRCLPPDLCVLALVSLTESANETDLGDWG